MCWAGHWGVGNRAGQSYPSLTCSLSPVWGEKICKRTGATQFDMTGETQETVGIQKRVPQLSSGEVTSIGHGEVIQEKKVQEELSGSGC